MIWIALAVGIGAGAVTAWIILFFAYRTAMKNANKSWAENEQRMQKALHGAYQQGATDIADKFKEAAKNPDSLISAVQSAKGKQTPGHSTPATRSSDHPKK